PQVVPLQATAVNGERAALAPCYNNPGIEIGWPMEIAPMIRWTFILFVAAGPLLAAETAAERGKKALLGKSYVPPTMALTAYDDAWKHWGLKEKPAAKDYARLFRQRYGLHPAPYANDGYPMGVRVAASTLPFTKKKMLTVDCLLCHGGS